MKKISAMSLLSLLIVLTMIVVVMAASAPIISQNLTKISKGKKKAGEVALSDKTGYFLCYYNSSNQLCYKQVEIDASNNLSVTGTNMAEDGTCSGSCKLIIPDADVFEITLVGAGGGGAIPYVENDFDSVVKEEEVVLGESATISPNIFAEYEDYIDNEEKWDILSKIFGNVSVVLKGNVGDNKVICAKDFGSDFLDELKSTKKLKFTNEKESFTYENKSSTKIKFYVNGQYKIGYDPQTYNCLTAPNPTLCGCYNSNSGDDDINNAYVAIRRKTGVVNSNIMTNTEPLSLKLISYATKVQDVTQAKAGEVRKYKTSFIAASGTSELTFTSSNIGQGGDGGVINGGVYTSAKNGGNTQIKINDIDMLASGGEAGKLVDEKYYRLSELVVGKKGENGNKPLFHIPSQLTISEKDLVIGMGSNCKKEGCTSISDSKYPGSSGANSGYNIGTNDLKISSDLDLRSKKMVRVEMNNGDILSPEGYSKAEGSPYRPNMTVKRNEKAGQGANGAILITW